MRLRPNLFSFATSELSQDAFICWLITWAGKKHKSTDSGLNKLAVQFVQKLLGKDNSYAIDEVKVKRQWKKIDVSALVNGQYFLVIEDKKGTKSHSNQLNRYSELAKKHYKSSDIEVKPVYFKMEEQGDYTKVEEAGFSVFGRRDMLEILEPYFASSGTPKNDIICDYYEHLKSLDEKIKSYSTKPLNEWNGWYSWQGFYAALQEHIGGNWEYVSNPAGGFLGFWWNWHYSKVDGKEFDYYLQLEQHKLIFKLYAYKANERREVRDFYRSHLYKKAKELNIDISQFGRISEYMGVARLKAEYRITDASGLLDLQATVENLRRIMQLMKETEKEITAHSKS